MQACVHFNSVIGPWKMMNIDSSNGFMLSSNNPFPEQILTKIYDAIWHHKATKS